MFRWARHQVKRSSQPVNYPQEPACIPEGSVAAGLVEWRPMDMIRHLSFFVAVAEEGHFGHAAERLGMTQPPLSQGVRRLEQRIGTDLVRRGPRSVSLTEAGRELLPRARLLVADAARFDEESRRVAGGPIAAVQWGVCSTVSDEIVVACVKAVRGDITEPSTRVSTITASTNELVDAVRNGTLDVAVVEHPAILTGLECGPVLSLRRWVIVPEDHGVATAKQPQLRMLRGLALTARPRSDNPPSHDLFFDVLRKRGLDPELRASKDLRDLLGQVASGECFGVTASPPRPVDGVVWVDMLRTELTSRLRIVWRQGHAPEAAIRALDRVLLKAGK